jgi:hypothetical protein
VRRYHHLGIPTRDRRPGERYLERFRMFVSGYEDSPFGIEWMRFEHDSPLPELVKTVPHVAFEVDDLVQELEGHQVLIEPNSPSEGVTVAFIVHDGAPVEFLQIDRSRPGAAAGTGGDVDRRPPEGGGGEEVAGGQ